MTTEELIEELRRYPGMTVCVRDDRGESLDDGVCLGVGVNHPGSYHDGRSDWHWEGEANPKSASVPGERVLVVY